MDFWDALKSVHRTFPTGFSDWARSPCLDTRRCSASSPNAHTPPHRLCIAAAAPRHVLHEQSTHTSAPHTATLGGPAALVACPHRVTAAALRCIHLSHCATAILSLCCAVLSPPRHSVASCPPASLRHCRRIRARGPTEATRLSFAINGVTTVLLRCHRPHVGMPPLLAMLARSACACASATSR